MKYITEHVRTTSDGTLIKVVHILLTKRSQTPPASVAEEMQSREFQDRAQLRSHSALASAGRSSNSSRAPGSGARQPPTAGSMAVAAN